MLELVVVAGIAGAMAAVAMPRKAHGLFGLRNARNTLVADMRTARGRAIGGAMHVRVEIADAHSYDVFRMKEEGNNWVQDGGPEISRTLPPSVSFSSGIGDGYEFNTRGMLVEPTSEATVTLVDSTTGNVSTVKLWLSGQVAGS